MGTIHSPPHMMVWKRRRTLARVVGVEEGDDEVDEDGEVEGDGPPQSHPPGEPVQNRHTCTQFGKKVRDGGTSGAGGEAQRVGAHSSASSATPSRRAGTTFARRSA